MEILLQMDHSPATIKALIGRRLAKGPSSTDDMLHIRGGGRGPLLRFQLPDGQPVIIKVWFARNLTERLKSSIRLSNARREWRMHRRVHRKGLITPRPVGFYTLVVPGGNHCEVVLAEDLGKTERGLPHLKKLISEAKESEVLAFENCLIEQTVRLIRAGILDIDHQLNNFVVSEQDHVFRIDFECARRYPFGIMPPTHSAKMLARFITGHVHAVQPDVERSVRFAERLYAALQTGAPMKRRVQRYVDANLARQLAHSGIGTRVNLPA